MEFAELEGKSWYLVFSKPKQEHYALENLQRQGYEPYLPLIRNRRRRRSKYVQIIEPLFPRYLFIYLDKITDNWAPIRSTTGVSRIVSFGFVPAQVPSDFVSCLMANEDPAGIQCIYVQEFQKGDRVRILEGPMSGYQGIYLAKTSKERVTILLNVLGKQSTVYIPADYLEDVRI